MTARLYTPLPDGKGHHGERVFVSRVVELGNARSHVWAGVDYLPGGVPDVDVIVVQEDIGCFNIEVKAVSLEMIEDFGLDVCRIKGRSVDHHPVKQAGVAQLGLRQYFGSVSTDRCPFLFATAAFPRIRRDQIKERFSNAPLNLQFEGMLFAEDMESSAAFLRRLSTIREGPPRGRPPVDARPAARQIAAMIEVLDPGARRVAYSDADKARGRVVANNVGRPGGKPTGSGPARKFLQPGDRRPVIFRGAPGTGKTVQLQEIAVAHARAGRAVLFTCFNKVLASTLRGILATQELGEAVNRRFVITHVDELRKQIGGDEIEAFRGLFGTVCVDEAQDMKEESFDFLKELAASDAEWFLADGRGQELYGPPSAFLEDARRNGTVESLRRNYRNSSAGFLVAQAVYEHAPNTSVIEAWVAKHPLKLHTYGSGELALGLPEIAPGGELPRVVRVDLPENGWRQAKLEAYVSVIFEELEKLAAEGNPRDLAIICAQRDTKSFEPRRARDALHILGVPVHDQIDPKQRGTVVPKDHVRLTTIHSARGIEACRVVLLDLAQGISLTDAHQQNSRIMSYIALSRAQRATTIVVPGDCEHPYVTFIERLVEAYRRS